MNVWDGRYILRGLKSLKHNYELTRAREEFGDLVKMSEALTLAAELREELGTGASRALRKRGMVPATIYGAGKEPLSISVEEKEITKYYRKPQYISQLFELEIGQKKFKVLPKAIQLHPITDIVSHVDFVFLESKMQKMHVPVIYLNKDVCLGVKRGGYFNTVKRFVTILCPVGKLPRKIEVDVVAMPIGSSLKAKDLSIPEGSKLLENPNFVIASIVGKKGKADEADEASTQAEPAKK